jgi:hypothetical protein
MNIEMSKKFFGMPCIFGRDKIHFSQNANGPMRHVFEISYRSGNYVELSGHD